MRSVIIQLLAASWGITLFFGGTCWVIAAVVAGGIAYNKGLGTALGFLGEPFILLTIVGVPLLLLLLQWLIRLTNKQA